MYIKKLLLFLVALILLAGCERQSSLNISSSVEHSEIVEEISDASDRVPAIDAYSAIRDRANELPDDFIKAIAENTGYIPDKKIEHIYVLKQEQYTIVDFGYGVYTVQSQPREFHVFREQAYIGKIEPAGNFLEPNFEKGKEDLQFKTYGEHTWLVINVNQVRTMGAAFRVSRQIWYEISHPDLAMSLSFVYNFYDLPFPDWYRAGATFSAFVDDQIVPSEKGDTFLLQINWNEDIDFSGADVTYTHGGVVEYKYFAGNGEFYQTTSNEIFYYYNTTRFDSGRDQHALFMTGAKELQKITTSGTDTQKEWLSHYLDNLGELDSIALLYEWKKLNSQY